jgi:hypothetical protein
MNLTHEQLKNMPESELREKILIPMFSAMGFQDVYEYHGGPGEQGKDIVMWKLGALHDRVNYAVVVKAKKISGKAAGTSSANEVEFQIRQAFATPFTDRVTTEDRPVHQCIVVCPHEIRKEALDALRGPLTLQHLDKSTKFLHGEELWKLIEKHVLSPLGRLEEARQGFLDSCSPQYAMSATLDREGVKVTVSSEEVISGSLSFCFPDSPEGREALDALARWRATGSAVEIPGAMVRSFTLPEELQSALGYPKDAIPLGVKMGKHRGAQRMLWKLALLVDGKVCWESGDLHLAVEQVGTEEVTLSSEAQPDAWRFRLVLTQPNQASLTWSAAQEMNAFQHLRMVRFLDAMGKRPTLRWTDARTGVVVAEMASHEVPVEPIEPAYLNFAEDLAYIQTRAGVVIQTGIPDRRITDQVVRETHRCATVLRTGRLEIPRAQWRARLKVVDTEGLKRWASGGTRSISSTGVEEVEILGATIALGPTLLSCEGAVIVGGESPETHEELARACAGEEIWLNFQAAEGYPAVVEYTNWMLGGSGGATPANDEH